ncbi:hypothetical protein GCM10027074_57380 [Streptomyces deserti]
MGAERPGPGLHPLGRGPPAPVEPGQDVHGIVAGVEEHAVPQVGDPVRLPLVDPDQAAAGPDALQLPCADLVPDAAGQDRQHREREQGLEGAGGWQFAVRVVRGEDLAGAGVGHQPRQGGDGRDRGRPRARPDLRAGAVQQGRLRQPRVRPAFERAGIRPRTGGRRGGKQRQQPCHTEGAGGHGSPGRKSDSHTANVGTDLSNATLPGPSGTREHPDGGSGEGPAVTARR